VDVVPPVGRQKDGLQHFGNAGCMIPRISWPVLLAVGAAVADVVHVGASRTGSDMSHHYREKYRRVF